ncbi:DUF1554 domain-containing protein [Leptospira mtsangambouensis]|uniref:DUF1554 domain-containing protein n=1 Tax=Leptospira mtsangambouensis TaxID=2484912 RepID=A0ABY2NX41_9LEPT|nr:DUF1554 domain-containing protein [Leptospira mtsangambouensis]TGM72893.1 DUF1554 domain-containing protein [Leptospira mtsangambouensis]
MRINVVFSFLCLLYFISCKPADLCNAADASSECGILQLAMPKPNSSSMPRIPHCSPCKLFVTSTAYNANLLGITGADSKCSSDTNKPTTGIYKALLVDDVNRRACTSTNCTSGGVLEQIDWVLAPNTSYESINTSNFIFTSDANGVFTNTLTNPFSAATGIWTGIKNNPNWDWQTDTSHTCSSWTDNISANCGTYGVTSWTDSRSIAITSAYASGGTLNNLLCVEQ